MVNERTHTAGEALNRILFKYKNSNKHILLCTTENLLGPNLRI